MTKLQSRDARGVSLARRAVNLLLRAKRLRVAVLTRYRGHPSLERGRNVGVRAKARELECFRLREQRASERVVERVAGLERGVLADQRVSEQVQVADRVQHLVLDELVVVAQALG